ncbi:MAG: hypothetical protein FWC64_08085 [Treponema sp.]|nr:hypothetical protein [Treponema sp.]
MFFVLPFAALLSLGGCGLLVGMPFIDPVPQGNVMPSGNDFATINLTNYFPHDDFENFIIFYRIYVSAFPVEFTPAPGPTFSGINPTLQTNYNTVHRFIDNDDLVGQNMTNIFRAGGMNFWPLAFANANDPNFHEVPVSQVLGSNIFARPQGDRFLVFDFSGLLPNPVMRIGLSNPQEFVLLRATGHLAQNIHFDPRPDRFFRNSDDLRYRGYLVADFNADVADRAGIPEMDRTLTYVAMFIVAIGTDPHTFANVYSTPALIHAFLLPD